MSGIPFKGFGTTAIHAGHTPDALYGTMVPSISTSTTFAQTAPGVPFGIHEYSRCSNPSRNSLETALAAVEDGKFGFAFSSGLSALTTICHLLKNGDHIISMDDVYGGTSRFLKQVALNYGIEVDFIDCTNIEALKAAVKPNTKMMWLETPTNPTLRILDIAACAAVAKEHNIISVVDNTFMSSYFQRPLMFGATIVMHSLTKYMNGHSDVVMGAAITNDSAIADRLKFLQNAIGTIPGPFDCYLVQRGLKTLHLRMRQHAINAMAVAKFLESSDKVDSVIYPGLASHPQHELAKKQMTGFGGMVSFRIKGGVDEATKFLQTVKVFTLAESLGAVECLAELPALMTHSGIPPEIRAALGITDNLVRLSCGVEDTEDIIADIKQALDVAVKN